MSDPPVFRLKQLTHEVVVYGIPDEVWDWLLRQRDGQKKSMSQVIVTLLRREAS